MQKGVIHYFTGTGNTARAVLALKENLEKNGYKIQLVSIRKGVKPPAEDFDLHIFAFPTLAWAAPVLFKRYIRKIPQGKGQKAVIITTCGHSPLQGIAEIESMLRRRGYKVSNTARITYPSNWTQMMETSKEYREKKLAEGDAQVDVFCESLINHLETRFRTSIGNKIWSKTVAIFFDLLGRRVLGKMFIADKDCNQCGLCINSCPVKSIRYSGSHKKPRWNFSCENCNRCINICPQNAIQTSLPRLLYHIITGAILAFPAVFITTLFYQAFEAMFKSPVAVIFNVSLTLIMIILMIWVQFCILDIPLFSLEQLPGLSGWFEKSFTKKFSRYTAPGFKPSQDIQV